MPRFAALAALAAAVAAISAAEVPEVELDLTHGLAGDDECAASTEGGCALNALQLRAQKPKLEKIDAEHAHEKLHKASEKSEKSVKQAPAIDHNWCRGHTAPPLWSPAAGGPPVQVKILSYNLFWWSLFNKRLGNNNSAGKLIRSTMQPPYDFMGFQECEDPTRVLEPVDLSSEYEAFLGAHAICMAYRNTTWKLLDRGEADVAEDMPTRYYGKRGTQWMRLQHIVTGRTAFFVNHHGPLSINSGGVCGGHATAENIAHLMATKGKSGDLLILVGDFNANAGSLTVQGLWSKLVHIFNGASFGGVDNIFSNAPRSSVVSTGNIGSGGSDHEAISAVLQLGGAVRAASASSARTPKVAVSDLTGPGKPGDDWQAFWCGRMEPDLKYKLSDSDVISTAAQPNPDWCCRACQQEPRCRSFVWGAGNCTMASGEPLGSEAALDVTSGLSFQAAAHAASVALASAIDSV